MTATPPKRRPDPAPSISRVTVNLPRTMWDDFSRASDADHLSNTEAVRRAISAYLFIREARREGAKIFLEMPDRSVQRVVFPD